jgi:hypothetical protein
MRRVRLVSSCLASPDGIFFRGHEVERDDDQAAAMVATGQWQYVTPPADPVAEAVSALPQLLSPAPQREIRGKNRPSTNNRKNTNP